MPVDAGRFRRQYCQGRSIFSESATAREEGGRVGREGGRGDRKWFPPGMPRSRGPEARGTRTAKHVSGTARSRAEVETHGSCRIRIRVARHRQSLDFLLGFAPNVPLEPHRKRDRRLTNSIPDERYRERDSMRDSRRR